MRFAVILAGGLGTRLWPLSRKHIPKQLIPQAKGTSLLEAAYHRLDGLIPKSRRYICGLEAHRKATKKCIPTLGSNYIGEPEGRDTLVAVTVAALTIQANSQEASILDASIGDACIAILTADQIIEPESEFCTIMEKAYSLVEEDSTRIVTFGILPQYASTAYGYLELSSPTSTAESLPSSLSTVQRFHEKPNQEVANIYVQKGPQHYLWNSGMYVAKASLLVNLISYLHPQLVQTLRPIVAGRLYKKKQKQLAAVYPALPKISFDFAVMEPACKQHSASENKEPKVQVLALKWHLAWKDVGSWTEYASYFPKDNAGNIVHGNVCIQNCKDTVVLSFANLPTGLTKKQKKQHLIACWGFDDIVLIRTVNATFLCPKSKLDDLKKFYSAIAMGGSDFI